MFRLSRWVKVIESGTVWSGIYDFVLVIHSNYWPIPYCFRDTSHDFGLKTQVFIHPVSLTWDTCVEGTTVRILSDIWAKKITTSCARGRTICPAPVRRTLQPSSSPYTPYACDAQRALRHEYSWSTGSDSLWLWLWCRPYKLCSDLKSQPKRPVDLYLWPLTSRVVSESRVTWATSVPILVFLGLSVLQLGPMYATDVRQTDVRQKHRLKPPPIRGGE